jgi:hypothetical protein
MGFVADEVALGQVSSLLLSFPLPIVIPPLLHFLIRHMRLVQLSFFRPNHRGAPFHPVARKDVKIQEIFLCSFGAVTLGFLIILDIIRTIQILFYIYRCYNGSNNIYNTDLFFIVHSKYLR